MLNPVRHITLQTLARTDKTMSQSLVHHTVVDVDISVDASSSLQ